MRAKTDAMQTNPGRYAYGPELVEAYVLEARRQRAEWIAAGWRRLIARARAWLTGGDPTTRMEAPRVVARSKPRSPTATATEARRAA